MKKNKSKQSQVKRQTTSGGRRAGTMKKMGSTPTRAGKTPPLLPARSRKLPSSYSVDVTGKIRKDIRIDPNITEGHPGYDESGDSEIIPTERLRRRGAGKR